MLCLHSICSVHGFWSLAWVVAPGKPSLVWGLQVHAQEGQAERRETRQQFVQNILEGGRGDGSIVGSHPGDIDKRGKKYDEKEYYKIQKSLRG